MGSKKLHNLYIISLSIAACGETIGGHHNWFGHQQPNEAVAHCRRPHRYCPPAGDSGRHFCHYHSRTKWLCKYRSLHKWHHQFLSLPLAMTSAVFKTNYLSIQIVYFEGAFTSYVCIFWHLTMYVSPLVCTFYVVILVFFWPPTHLLMQT